MEIIVKQREYFISINQQFEEWSMLVHYLRKLKFSSKCDFSDAVRPLNYPIELYDELLKWIFVLRDLHFPLWVFKRMSLQEKAKLVIQPHNSSFNKSRGWVRKFFNRHKLVLRTRTSISQKLPKQLEGVFSIFYEDAARFMRIEKYPLSPAGNMDQTPAFFCHGPIKVFWKEVRGRMWFVPQGLKKTTWQLFCQPQQMDKCFHPW